MISSWAAWALTLAGFVSLSVGAYLIGRHKGYILGRANRIGEIPGNPWRPPSEAEFLAELIEAERLRPEPPRKYRREP
jgi:hypothetical protein